MSREQIRGSCSGYKRGAVFELTNGQTWEQTSYEYQYSYSYRPDIELDASERQGRLKLDGMSGFIDVKRVR